MIRCADCGGFFVDGVCPNGHTAPPAEPYIPPPLGYRAPPRYSTRGLKVGDVVEYEWPNEGPVTCLVVSLPDDEGMIGLMILHSHVRVNHEDVERIAD